MDEADEELQHKRSFRMGRRNDKNIPKQSPGKMSRNRWAWCRVYFGQFVIWVDYFSQSDEVQDIKLVYPIPNRPAVNWNLTACTEEELIALKEFFDKAFELALPICKERDREAKDAFEQGDDSFARIYRTAPQLVYRPWPEREYSEGVQHRSEDAAGVSRLGEDRRDRLREVQPGLAESDQAEGSSEDDGATFDVAAKLRQVGRLGDASVGIQSSDSEQDNPSPDPRGVTGSGTPPPSIPHP